MSLVESGFFFFPSDTPPRRGSYNICEFGILRTPEQEFIPVAVRSRLIDSEEERESFEQERVILETLNALDTQRQYFAHYYGSIGRSFYFRRYDCDLEVVLKNNRINPAIGIPYTEQQISIFAQEIIHAVAFMHRQGWVHRDVKPSNILVSNHAVLSDFELSRPRNAADVLSIDATPYFFPPEYWLRIASGYSSMDQGYLPEADDSWRVGLTVSLLMSPPSWFSEMKSILDSYNNLYSPSARMFTFLVRKIQEDDDTLLGLIEPDHTLRKSLIRLSDELQQGEHQ